MKKKKEMTVSGFMVDKGVSTMGLIAARHDNVLQQFMLAWTAGFAARAMKDDGKWSAVAFVEMQGLHASLETSESLDGAIFGCVRNALRLT